jgi:anti-sigma B factor antagonist
MVSAGGQPGDPEGLDRVSEGPVVTLDGDLDIVTSEDVKRQLAALVKDGNRTVTLDMGAVEFVDSSGLGALVAVHQLASAKGSHHVVRSVPSQVQSLLRLTRLDDLLSVE